MAYPLSNPHNQNCTVIYAFHMSIFWGIKPTLTFAPQHRRPCCSALSEKWVLFENGLRILLFKVTDMSVFRPGLRFSPSLAIYSPLEDALFVKCCQNRSEMRTYISNEKKILVVLDRRLSIAKNLWSKFLGVTWSHKRSKGVLDRTLLKLTKRHHFNAYSSGKLNRLVLFIAHSCNVRRCW